MSTYRYDFTIANAPPGQSGQYPLATQSTTFMPETSIFFQHGDTIQAKHTHPTGLNINYTGPDVHGANPDPTVKTSLPSGDTRTLTWSGTFQDEATPPNTVDFNDDYFTQWFFFANDGTDNIYSQKIVYRRVKITSFTTSATTVEPGESITFGVGGLTGFPNASGANGNRLYISIFPAGAASLVGTNYISWNNSNNQLGRVTTSDTFPVLQTSGTAGNLPDGTYNAYITHYGGETALNGSLLVGNRFYGSERRLRNNSGVIFTKSFTVATPTNTTPTNFSLGADIENSALNATWNLGQVTVAGMDSGASTSVSVSGQGAPRFSINGGSYNDATVTNLTVSNGDTVDMQMSASGEFNTPHTATLNIGGVEDSMVVTTIVDPGTGGGGSGSGTGTGDFGLIVKNAATPPAIIFGPGIRSSHLLGSKPFVIAANSSIDVGPFEGFTGTNISTCGFFLVAANTGNVFIGYQIVVTRGLGNTINGIDVGKVRISNSSSYQVEGRYYAVRY
tara:strand:- start:1506 stop:3020 length:1515 start_codon:yes stop_codon:yes gene_type:complete